MLVELLGAELRTVDGNEENRSACYWTRTYINRSQIDMPDLRPLSGHVQPYVLLFFLS